MGRLQTLGRTGAAVLGLTAVLAWPAPARAAPDESIASYRSRIEVRADGRLQISETIAYDFGGNRRHGIYRRIPTTVRYDDTHDRVYPVADVEVTMDGAAVPMAWSTDGDYQVFRIGDANRTVTGVHTYVLAFTVRGAVNSFADHEELYWNVVGGEWPVPVRTARAEVTGPAPIRRARCFAGPAGSRHGCGGVTVDGATATFRQDGLDPGSALTAVAAFPAGSIGNPGPSSSSGTTRRPPSG